MLDSVTLVTHTGYRPSIGSRVDSAKFGMVCSAGLGVLPRYYCSKALLALAPVSEENPMGTLRFAIENQKPRLQVCPRLQRVVYGVLPRCT